MVLLHLHVRNHLIRNRYRSQLSKCHSHIGIYGFSFLRLQAVSLHHGQLHHAASMQDFAFYLIKMGEAKQKATFLLRPASSVVS
jgi:hypothetical protein